MKYKFMKETDVINLSETIRDIEDRIFTLNGGEYGFVFHQPEKLVSIISEMMDGIDFAYTDYISDYGCYWCGCLTAEPFCELSDYLEYEILNLMLHENTEAAINENGDMVIRFWANKDSTLHSFFRKYADGYGGNIPYSYNSMLSIVEGIIKEQIESDPESDYRNKFGEWECYIDNAQDNDLEEVYDVI